MAHFRGVVGSFINGMAGSINITSTGGTIGVTNVGNNINLDIGVLSVSHGGTGANNSTTAQVNLISTLGPGNLGPLDLSQTFFPAYSAEFGTAFQASVQDVVNTTQQIINSPWVDNGSYTYQQYPTHNVGIGTSTPADALDVTRSSVGGLGGRIVIKNTAVTTSGNSANLSFKNSADFTGAFYSAQISNLIYSSSNGDQAIAFSLYGHGSGPGGAERMRITSEGRLGVNNTAPAYPLDVNNNGGVVARFGGLASASFPSLILDGGGTANSSFDVGCALSTQAIRLYGGTSYSTGPAFQIWPTGSTFQGMYFDAGTATGADIMFRSSPAGTNAMVIKQSSGNVGIGTSSPTAALQLKAGTATAGSAPLKFTSGTNLTTPEAGAMEWDGTRAYLTQTTGPTRKTVAYLDDLITAAPGILSNTIINAKTVANTLIYTVPAGKTCVVTGYVVRCTAATAITNGPAAGVGLTAGTNDISASQAMNALTGTTNVFNWPIVGMSKSSTASIYFNLGTAATGTSQTIVVDLMGYLI